MRIFHLITHFDLGGAERVAANIAESATDGVESHVVEIMRGRSAYTPRFMAELRGHGVRLHRSWMPDVRWHFALERVAALLFPLRLLYILLRWRPDVLHTHTETPDLALYVASLFMPRLMRRVRIVRTIHNTRLWTGLPRTAMRVERFFCAHGANVAISESVRDAYAKRFGQVPPIIYNGVAQVGQRTYDGLAAGRTNILFAGRLEPQKGIDTLCRVLQLMADDTRYHFTIAGDGSQRAMVEDTIAGKATGRPMANARLVPPIYSLASYMQSFDYLLMPSEFEGLSMLSMEASMNGLPVIANDAPGLRDTLPTDWPLMAHGNSIDDYRHLFGHVLPGTNHALLADKARAFALSHFSIRLMQQRYEAFYS